MAWNNKDPYSSYGEYNDAQFYSTVGADTSAYEMFDDVQHPANDPYAGSWEGQTSGYGFYDPNSFQQPSPQPPSQMRVPTAKSPAQQAG